MSKSTNGASGMNRRDFLQCAVLIAAGASQAPLTWALSRNQNEFIASQPPYINRVELSFFTEEQRLLVAALAEQIIPRTDTPGAVDAGVPKFIESMVATWFDDDERDFLVKELAALDKRAGTFTSLDKAAQLDLLETVEQETADSSWYNSGNVFRVWDPSAPFICQFKELTVLGFMLSETASKEFLQPMPMGSFNGSLAMEAGHTAYAPALPMRSASPPISAMDDVEPDQQ